MAPLRVLHLVGSPTDDFYADLSRLYASDCLAATADPSRYATAIAWVEPGGRWRFPAGLTLGQIAAAPTVGLAEAMARLAVLAPDVMVPQLFCRAGMTAYRGLFDVLGIPYVGNPADVMALGATKARAKAVVAAAGVAVPAGRLVRPGDLVDLSLPVVVKPADADNSLGVSLVRDAAGLDDALSEAFAHSAEVLVETYVELGREVRCGVLDGDGVLVPLPLEEYAVDSETKPVRLADDKIVRADDGDLALVAKKQTHAWLVDPDDPQCAAVWDAARLCHEALGCRDYSLFDFRIDPDGVPHFLEASLYNSFAHQSVLVVMAQAAGITLPDLFDETLRRAAARRVGRHGGSGVRLR